MEQALVTVTSELDTGRYLKLSTENVLRELGGDLEKGLSEVEAERRRRQFGPNEVLERKQSLFVKFALKFWGVTAWMLELTMTFSLILDRLEDFYVIAALLVANAVIGVTEEQRATGAVEQLKQRLQVNARVLRDGVWKLIPARVLVPGDIIRVRAGDFVPADAKITSRSEVSVDQSVLTGESLSVQKAEGEILYSGAIVQRGECGAIVVATGGRTYYGRTAELLEKARPKLHVEEVTSSIVRWLLVMVVALVAFMLVASYLSGSNILQVVPLALVLIVFAVPVALPAMFTVSMALGSLELAKKGVLVTRLGASEDAASMDVLCVDKTGTITSNKLSVAGVYARGRFTEDEVVLNGALASQEANQDPIDSAFLEAAKERGLLGKKFEIISFIPFDPSTRRTEAIIRSEGKTFRATKGAVEVLLKLCGEEQLEASLEESVNEFARKGYRTLGVAVSDTGKFELCGIAALYDPPRTDSSKFIRELDSLGVSVKMLTGDALPIAREIATEVGLTGPITSFADIRSELQVNPSEAKTKIEVSEGFAEIYPEDKYLIVKHLQEGGHVVGMTGDGVNDAPALRQAEVGIAVSNATDVAKSAASSVLTNTGLLDMVSLIQVGRMIYQRMITWVLNKIVKTFQVAIFVAVAFLLIRRYVVSTLDIILLLFVIDFVTVSLSTDRVRGSSNPEKWNVSGLVKLSAALGVFTLAELFGLLFIGLKFLDLSREFGSLQTFVFASLFYLGMFTVLIVRERGVFWSSTPSKTLILAIGLDMLVVALLVTTGFLGIPPIPPEYLAIVVFYVAAVSFTINDAAKRFLIRSFRVAD